MPRKGFRANKGLLSCLGRGAIVWVVTCGLCVLNFPERAQARDGSVASSATLTHLQFGAPANPILTVDRPTVPPRWKLVPDPAWLVPPAASKFQASGEAAAEPTRFANYSFAVPRPVATPKAALPAAGSTAGRGRWLALGIGGVVVAAAGAVTYGGERSVCRSNNPGQGCNDVRTAGLVLMPVGATMAVVGFVMHSRH